MYCGICVEVCPFDALFWSPEYEYSEPRIADLLHDKTKLGEWMETVPEAPELEAGAAKKNEVMLARPTSTSPRTSGSTSSPRP